MLKRIALLILVTNNLFAQNNNAVWCFGDSAGIDFNNLSNPLPIVSGMDSRGSCITYADSSGNLILYTATMPYFGPYFPLATKVFNYQNQMLIGADSITGSAWYSELALFPKPGDTSSNLFYVFSNSVGQAPNPGMYYTLVDMSLNGGQGGVVLENIQIDNNYYGDCNTCIKHGNGRDWWVISKLNMFPFTFHNRFFKYLVTADSIYPPIIQDFNDASDVSAQKIIWHPILSKFMLINVRGYMAEFDFDRCSGVITLSRLIFPELNNLSRAFWGGAYSPNGNIFYTSRTSYGGNAGDYNYLLQYDLTAIDIPASCDTLDSTLYPPIDGGDLRLAPDGKIYYSQAYISQTVLSYPYADSMYNYINQNLGVINNPDVVGNGCNFSPFSFYLGGKRTYYGLPNNPNYSLGPDSGSICDTISTSINEHHPNAKRIVLHIAPNPVSKTLYFNAEHVTGHNAVVYVRNSLGTIVFKKTLQVYNGGYATKAIDVSSFSSGIYFITLQSEREIISAKFVKE